MANGGADASQGEGWWQASYGKWYPPQTASPSIPPPPPPQTPSSPPVAATERTRSNGLAVASLVLGILWLFWIGSVLAVIFGHLAHRQIDASHGPQVGRGMATAGLVLGYIGVGILLILVIGIVASA